MSKAHAEQRERKLHSRCFEFLAISRGEKKISAFYVSAHEAHDFAVDLLHRHVRLNVVESKDTKKLEVCNTELHAVRQNGLTRKRVVAILKMRNNPNPPIRALKNRRLRSEVSC